MATTAGVCKIQFNFHLMIGMQLTNSKKKNTTHTADCVFVYGQSRSTPDVTQSKCYNLTARSQSADIWISDGNFDNWARNIELDILDESRSLNESNAFAQDLGNKAIISNVPDMNRRIIITKSGIFDFIDFFARLQNLNRVNWNYSKQSVIIVSYQRFTIVVDSCASTINV